MDSSRSATNRLISFVRLPSADRWLWGEALLCLAAVRVGLWVAPFGSLQRVLHRWIRMLPTDGEVVTDLVPVVAWAVRSAGRWVPRATCLTQALAAQFLLARRGRRVSVQIGVGRSEANRFEAHAWLECDGAVVIGGGDSRSRYTHLTTLGEGGA
jgi:hypothetical protein